MIEHNYKRLVALCGYKGSGKSTVARLLRQHGWWHTAFAKPLKEMLQTMGLRYEQVWGSEKEVPSGLLGGKTPRYAMQMLGTEWGRALFGDDHWVRVWEASLMRQARMATEPSAGAPCQGFVVDDLRFPNELEAVVDLRKHGWKVHVMRVNRPSCEPAGPVEALHPSERLDLLDDKLIDLNLQNTVGSVEQFRKTVFATFHMEGLV